MCWNLIKKRCTYSIIGVEHAGVVISNGSTRWRMLCVDQSSNLGGLQVEQQVAHKSIPTTLRERGGILQDVSPLGPHNKNSLEIRTDAYSVLLLALALACSQCRTQHVCVYVCVMKLNHSSSPVAHLLLQCVGFVFTGLWWMRPQ